MNARELFHRWANQSKPSGKAGNVFYEGDTCYSYGRHFPVGKLVTIEGKDFAFLNPSKYSMSTGRHQSYARQAIHSRECVHLESDLWNVETLAALEKAKAEQEKRDAAHAEQMKEIKRSAAKRARERKKQEQARIANYPAELEAWRAGGPFPYMVNQRPIALRLIEDGKKIQTSRHAIIPTCAARRAWPVIQSGATDKEFDWTLYKGLTVWGNEGEKFVQIGCHNIPMREIEAMAVTLGLT